MNSPAHRARPARPAHIAVIGSALSGNKGAAAMLEAAIQTLRARLGDDTRFTLFSVYPDEDAALNHDPLVEIVPADPLSLGITINLLALAYRLLPPLRPLLRRHPAIRALTSADVLLDQGGITFTDGREKFLLYNVATILPALNVGLPVFKCAQAIGPFRNPINRLVSKLLLPRVRTTVTRGRITHEYAAGLGLTNIVPGADYAFSLDLSGHEKDEVAGLVDVSFFDSGDVVGICPSVVLSKKVAASGGDYDAQIAEFISGLLREGRKVALIPHSVRIGTEATHNNDLPLCTRIAGLIEDPSDRLLFVDQELTSQQLRWLIGRCETFVASRFHAMVSALATAVPVVVIGWSHKYQEVLEMFGAEQWAFGSAELTPAFLRGRFDALYEQRDAVRATLAQHLPDVRALSESQADLIASLVAG